MFHEFSSFFIMRMSYVLIILYSSFFIFVFRLFIVHVYA